jgi:hypothetical protein
MKTSIDGAFADDNPIAELVAIAEQKKALARREVLAVRRARHAGLGWAEIGTLLGVTKQTAHRKYRDIG